MLHTGERPFLCGKCGRRFARGDALIRHKKASGTCYVTFVAEDKTDPSALDKQMQLPLVSSPQKKPLEPEKQQLPQQKPQLSQPPPSGINSGLSILPSILNSANNSTNTRSDSSIPISLPPISNPTYQTASSLPFPSQQQLRKPSEERSYFHASQKPLTEVESPTSTPATPAGKGGVTNGQEQPPAAISLYAQQQIHKRSSISSITSPMPASNKPTTAPAFTASSSSLSPTPTNEPSTSFSNILSSPYTRSVSVSSTNFSHSVNAVQPAEQENAKLVLSSPSPTTIPTVGNPGSAANNDNSSNTSRNNSTSSSNNKNNNNNNNIDNNSWQIIKMLENRVRALEERLNSSEGRVSFLENQLSALR